MNKQIGTTKRSYGYKADGKISNNKPQSGEDYGPKYEINDVVGSGIIFSKKQIFFTYNGRYLGSAFSGIEVHD